MPSKTEVAKKAVPAPRRGAAASAVAQEVTDKIVASVTEAAGVTAEVVTVTPEMAEEMLSINVGNRKLRSDVVDLYARDMANGNWQLTGDGPRIAADGTLIDGQHRLRAVVKADVPVRMFVFRGIDVSAKAAIDTGAKRTIADYLGWAGEVNPAVLAAAVRLAISIDRNAVTGKKVLVTTQETFQYISDHPEIREAARIVTGLRSIGASPAVLGYCIWRISEVDPEKALEFFYAVAEREGLYRGDPRHTLAKRFEQARLTRQTLNAVTQVSLIFRAWNAWRRGEQLTFLRVNSSAGGDVPIPTLI